MKPNYALPVLSAILYTTVVITTHAAYPFNDDFEAGATAWSTSGTWALTTLKSHSATHAMTDSPGAFYTNNTDSALTMAASIDLSGATNPAMRFSHRYALESDYDYGRVEVSINGGSDWTDVMASYTDTQDTWREEQLNLGDYVGEGNTLIRFRILTDASVVRDGWWIDDVRIDEMPEPATELFATNLSTTSIELRWTPSTSPTVSYYAIYRTTINSNSTHDAVLIGEVSGASSSNITDITVAPKTSYRYRVDAVNANGMRSPGAELILVTLAGMDYPFIDTAEGSDALWLNESPWAISDEQSYGPGHAWSDSPGTNYTNGINTVLRLAAPLDLTATTAPALSFVHQLDFQGGDSANAEVSPDGGTNWITLGTYNGSTDNAGPVPLRGCPVREDTIATGYCIWQMILPE